MTGLQLLLGKEIREQVRTLRLPVVVIIFTILGLASPLLARYIREIIEVAGGAQFQGVIPDPVAADAVIQFTKNLGQFGVLITILVTMGAVANEKERGTAAFLLTKPVARDAFLGAKLAAISGLLAVATALAGVACWFYTAVLFEPLPLGGFGVAVVLVWLSLVTFASVTFLASVVAPSALVAGGIGLGALLLSGLLSALPGVGAYLPTGLWSAADAIAVGRTADPLLGPVLVQLAVIAAAILLAGWSFRRQEL